MCVKHGLAIDQGMHGWRHYRQDIGSLGFPFVVMLIMWTNLPLVLSTKMATKGYGPGAVGA